MSQIFDFQKAKRMHQCSDFNFYLLDILGDPLTCVQSKLVNVIWTDFSDQGTAFDRHIKSPESWLWLNSGHWQGKQGHRCMHNQRTLI
jgi:hypothetical protein